MNDHRKIALRKNPWQRFTPETAFRTHCESRQFIETALRATLAGRAADVATRTYELSELLIDVLGVLSAPPSLLDALPWTSAGVHGIYRLCSV
jgi:hypothetical protein